MPAFFPPAVLERARAGTRPRPTAGPGRLPTPQFPDAPTGRDGERELLVAGGEWKHAEEVSPVDRLATVDIASGALSYVPYTARDTVWFAGDLVHLTHRSLDVLVGPAHQLPVRVWDARAGRLADAFSTK